MSTGAGGALWRIACDSLVTRRKLYQIVVTPEGRHAFHARRLGDCIDFLREHTEGQIWLDFPERPSMLCTLPGYQRKDP